MNNGNTDVAKASIKMAISSRSSEEKLISAYKEKGILTTAVDIGGDFSQSATKIIERALVASKRSGLIKENYISDGAVVGAAKEALLQIAPRANGFNVGGKIGIARFGENICVCIFMNVGLLHLNDVVIGLAHRLIPQNEQ